MNPNPLRFLGDGLAIVDKEGKPTREFLVWLRQLQIKTDPVLTGPPSPGGPPAGKINSSAQIAGRSEGVGTTVQHLDTAGKLVAPGVGFTVDGVPDGAVYVRTTPDERDGGGRGFNTLTPTYRLKNSFRNNPVNVSSVPTATTDLSNDGASTAIPVAASLQQFGSGQVAYDAGSVDPGGFGTFYVYADDPEFAGGSVPYQVSANPVDQTANDGRVSFGAITTTGGTPQTGGGYQGGSTPGGGGGRGYNQL